MLHTMLLGHPPAGGSTDEQLYFPQQPELSVEAKELLAALLRCVRWSTQRDCFHYSVYAKCICMCLSSVDTEGNGMLQL
jgi:hypothetical protein